MVKSSYGAAAAAPDKERVSEVKSAAAAKYIGLCGRRQSALDSRRAGDKLAAATLASRVFRALPECTAGQSLPIVV